MRKRAKEALNLVGFPEKYYKQSPFELSGGQKRRVAIAGVLAMRPKVLVLDEPTAGLDPKGRDEILDQVERLHKETGMTVILVSHSMEDVAKYVERIIVMNRGGKMLDGTPGEVFRHYKELEEVGLAAPQVTYVMHDLKERGFDLSPDATTIEEAADEIIEELGMIRDITIGQYYPAESRIHRLDPRVKIICTLLFLVSLFIQNSLLGYVIATVFPRRGHTAVKSPAEIYSKGAEAHSDPPSVYRGHESLPHSGRGKTGAFLDLYDYGKRAAYFCFYGCEADVSCGRFVDHDIYDFAQRADRWDGKTSPSP